MQNAGFTMTRRDSPDLRRENDSISVREAMTSMTNHHDTHRENCPPCFDTITIESMFRSTWRVMHSGAKLLQLQNTSVNDYCVVR